MNKHEIAFSLDVKYGIAADYEDEGKEVPAMLSNEIEELESEFIKLINQERSQSPS
ncbi:hypothetical protein [Vibrio atypicus]|uniref:hypothetical protein n=1 Tax=Vibrio atypicus TaxID=558271 RepID=UPI003735F542